MDSKQRARADGNEAMRECHRMVTFELFVVSGLQQLACGRSETLRPADILQSGMRDPQRKPEIASLCATWQIERYAQAAFTQVLQGHFAAVAMSNVTGNT